MTFPQSQRVTRPPRIRPSEYTPTVLRIQDGSCTTGALLVFSITGGLLSLPRPLDRGTRVKLMFLVKSGPVMGTAEMLKPVSWTEQPFRFVTLLAADQQRLRAVTGALSRYVSPVFKSQTLSLPPKPEPKASPADQEQQWIEKYRAATAPARRSRRGLKHFSAKLVFATLTAMTVGAGLVYALQTHLLR